MKIDTSAETQNSAILRHLLDGHKITSIQALSLYGCFRLSARIHDLKKTHNIDKRMVTLVNGKRVAQYFMVNGKG
jgi:hypothetical protein